MNNEELNKWLADEIMVYSGCCSSIECVKYDIARETAIKMAKWKDEQFSKFLLWLDDFYVIRKFDDGEPMTYGELIDEFKNMDK